MGTPIVNGWSMTSKRLACALLAASALLIAAPSFAQTPPHGGPGHAPHFAFAHHDFAHFSVDEHARWVGGRWNHGWHNGRYGWWWFAGGAWYFYTSPIYPYPGYVSDYYVDADDEGVPPGQYWYYCQSPPGYYPYIRRCMVPWQPVPAAAPPSYGPGPGYGPPPGADGGPSDGPPPGYQQGPGPNDQPPPGYEEPPPGDQPPQGYQGPGPGDQGPSNGPPGYPQGYQNQPPPGPPHGPGDHPPPGN